MKTVHEMIQIMYAYERGEKIQFLNRYNAWEDTDNPTWNWFTYDYRIKPKEYVPFETIKEFLNAQSIHGRGIIAFGELYTESYIDCYCNVFLYKRSTINNWTFNFEKLFKKCTFSDGTPCGKEAIK